MSGWVGDANEERTRLVAVFKDGGFAMSAAPRNIWDEAQHKAMHELRVECLNYRSALGALLGWPEVQIIPGLTTHRFAKDVLDV